jgi:hypothetical protein
VLVWIPLQYVLQKPHVASLSILLAVAINSHDAVTDDVQQFRHRWRVTAVLVPWLFREPTLVSGNLCEESNSAKRRFHSRFGHEVVVLLHRFVEVGTIPSELVYLFLSDRHL